MSSASDHGRATAAHPFGEAPCVASGSRTRLATSVMTSVSFRERLARLASLSAVRRTRATCREGRVRDVRSGPRRSEAAGGVTGSDAARTMGWGLSPS